jgi:hypothetical protein
MIYPSSFEETLHGKLGEIFLTPTKLHKKRNLAHYTKMDLNKLLRQFQREARIGSFRQPRRGDKTLLMHIQLADKEIGVNCVPNAEKKFCARLNIL